MFGGGEREAIDPEGYAGDLCEGQDHIVGDSLERPHPNHIQEYEAGEEGVDDEGADGGGGEDREEPEQGDPPGQVHRSQQHKQYMLLERTEDKVVLFLEEGVVEVGHVVEDQEPDGHPHLQQQDQRQHAHHKRKHLVVIVPFSFVDFEGAAQTEGHGEQNDDEEGPPEEELGAQVLMEPPTLQLRAMIQHEVEEGDDGEEGEVGA
mmetsp:Transcript_32671/g.31891  ORF Transcript_32671/g.31891 Transcript_32671/m.31891 type:complete len:205 (-) Transcript_32671:3278-3892(-)